MKMLSILAVAVACLVGPAHAQSVRDTADAFMQFYRGTTDEPLTDAAADWCRRNDPKNEAESCKRLRAGERPVATAEPDSRFEWLVKEFKTQPAEKREVILQEVGKMLVYAKYCDGRLSPKGDLVIRAAVATYPATVDLARQLFEETFLATRDIKRACSLMKERGFDAVM